GVCLLVTDASVRRVAPDGSMTVVAPALDPRAAIAASDGAVWLLERANAPARGSSQFASPRLVQLVQPSAQAPFTRTAYVDSSDGIQLDGLAEHPDRSEEHTSELQSRGH